MPQPTPPRRIPERTIARSVVVNGQGLHSGVRTGLILQPLPPGSGIVFGSIATGETVPALVDYVDSTGYATTLVRGGMVAKTVEHLLATLHAYGITNLLVKMQGEVPILDGSAQEFCELLDEGGVDDQRGHRRGARDRPPLRGRLRRPGSRRASAIEPGGRLRGALHRSTIRAPIGRQEYTFRLDRRRVVRAARSRRRARSASCKEIARSSSMGLASGGRLNNCILVGDEGVVNAPLRFPDEFVRHKILDIFGDFYLLGRPIRGRIVARMTGHGDNVALLKVLRARFGAASTA